MAPNRMPASRSQIIHLKTSHSILGCLSRVNHMPDFRVAGYNA